MKLKNIFLFYVSLLVTINCNPVLPTLFLNRHRVATAHLLNHKPMVYCLNLETPKAKEPPAPVTYN